MGCLVTGFKYTQEGGAWSGTRVLESYKKKGDPNNRVQTAAFISLYAMKQGSELEKYDPTSFIKTYRNVLDN